MQQSITAKEGNFNLFLNISDSTTYFLACFFISILLWYFMLKIFIISFNYRIILNSTSNFIISLLLHSFIGCAQHLKPMKLSKKYQNVLHAVRVNILFFVVCYVCIWVLGCNTECISHDRMLFNSLEVAGLGVFFKFWKIIGNLPGHPWAIVWFFPLGWHSSKGRVSDTGSRFHPIQWAPSHP